MKTIALLLSMMISFTLFAQKADSIKKDSTKLTASQVYKDVKEVLASLGQSLKVGSEHVYGVLIKQQLVNSITGILSLIFFGYICWITYRITDRKVTEWDKESSYEAYGALYLVPGILGLIFIITFFCMIGDIITGFVNPEYGALKDIFSLIKGGK